jgi:tetratricopeptide (TPR) repeat protein/glycosyltransferase involved in cell wall biosynthesis
MKQDSLALLKKALERQQAAQPEAAESLCRQVLRGDPANPDALHLLGVLELQRGRHQAAADWILQAIRVSPNTGFYHNNLGVAHRNLGRLAEAAACFQTATRLQPASYDAHFNLGAALQGLQRVDAAIAAYEKALSLNKNPGVLNNLGVAWLDRREFPKAIACLEQALKLQPGHADALYNLASALQESGQPEKALPYYEKRAALPHPPPALPRQLALAFQQSNRWQEAESWYRKALEEQPTAFVCNNLALVLERQFAFAEAESLLRRAISLRPEFAEAFSNLGNVMLAAGRPQEAVLAYSQAIDLKPGYPVAHYNRAHARLTLGDFQAGWNDYEYRWQWEGFPHRKPAFTQPEWTGDDLRGRTLLVYNEQGLGDTIQFARCLTLAAARGGKVLFTCPKELRTLFQGLAGPVQVLEPGQPPPPFDVHAALLSLPRLCGIRLHNIPNQTPYLTVPPAERFPLPPRTPGRLRVGLVWAGGTRFPKDGLRSMTARHFLPLLQDTPCDFFSLQAGPKAAELKSLPEGVKVWDAGSRLRDFADTAAVMGQLDLVISTCTSTLHLAGALARPAWGLLSYAPDWRWLRGREDSPWYPTVRLFRQAAPGDWAGVLERAQQALARLACQHESSAAPPSPEWFLPRPAPAAAPAAALPPEGDGIFMAGQTGGGFGWGVVNQGLLEELRKLAKTTLITPSDREFFRADLPGFFLTTLHGHEFIPQCPARARVNLGNAVFEQELTARSLENARRFDVVFTGSTWCLERLREKGLQHGALLLQGINTRVFHPAPGGHGGAGGRFVLFSGGKFELRKGQDLVLRAFRVLSRKFPDMALVTAWHNLWPQSLQTMAASPHIKFELRGAAWPEQLAHLCRINDIDPARVTAIKPAAPEQLAQIYRQSDLGLFPNRCEGATNLVLMEFLACGRPAVVSFNSGHCDLVHEGNAILLQNQRDLEIKDPAGALAARWREVSVDEIIAAVEQAYHDRARLRALGAAAGEDLKQWDWSRSARVVVETMSRFSSRPISTT